MPILHLRRTPVARRCGVVLAALGAGGGLAGCAAAAPAPGEAGVPGVTASPSRVTPGCMSQAPPSAEPTVKWIPPEHPDDALRSEAWCSEVGPAVLGAARPSPPPGATWASARPSPAVVDTLVVVTWNVHVGGGDVLGIVRDLRSGTLIGRPVESFVLLLQEAHRGGDHVPSAPGSAAFAARIATRPPSGERIDVVEAAHRLGLHVFYAPSMRNGGHAPPGGVAEDRGNAILSTLPLRDPVAVELPFEAQRRVAVAATVDGVTRQGAPWQLRVASGHLDVRTRASRFLDMFGAARARQAGALADALHGEAVVLGADLNTWVPLSLEGALDILYERFEDSPPVDGHTFLAGGLLPLRLDHLLVRLPGPHRVAARRVDHRYGSDHHPLLGVVRFAGQAPSVVTAGSERP